VVAPSEIDWGPWIFAAKTTAAALIALLVAFTFNLDQPQWTLLSVFIVAEPRRDGAVLAKSFYRIIGTFIGAVVALLLVALVAQERVLFLGGLALWIGVCTLGSQFARSWAAYSFVLSGYTAAIVGIPGALGAGDAFYIAMARVTEVCLGIMTSATVAHVILPDSVAASLDKTLADGRCRLVAYAVSVLTADRLRELCVEVLRDTFATEDLLRSAIFENQRIRKVRERVRALVGASIDVVASSLQFERQLDHVRTSGYDAFAGLERVRNEAIGATRAWESGQLSAAALGQRLDRSSVGFLPTQTSRAVAAEPHHDVALGPILGWRLTDFFAALGNYALAYEAVEIGGPGPKPQIFLANQSDFLSALLTGLRAALAVALAGGFWIITDWPHGSTATILAAVATARVATMGHAVVLATAAALIFSFSAFPAFFVIETLLPLTSDFLGFALTVGPMLFLFAFLMAFERTMIIGYLSALLFASVGAFQNQMAYNPIDLVNSTIAVVLVCCLTLVLWAVIAPDSPRARRRRFVRVARRVMAPISAVSGDTSLVEFEAAMGGALSQFAGLMQPDGADDRACLDAGIALLGAGRELLLVGRDSRRPPITALRQPPTHSSDRSDAYALQRHVLQELEIASATAFPP
jgi:uncharacterized membrane protein YccC